MEIMQIIYIVSSILCALLLGGYLIAYNTLKHSTDLEIKDLNHRIDLIRLELNQYKKQAGEKFIPHTTKEQREVKITTF